MKVLYQLFSHYEFVCDHDSITYRLKKMPSVLILIVIIVKRFVIFKGQDLISMLIKDVRKWHLWPLDGVIHPQWWRESNWTMIILKALAGRCYMIFTWQVMWFVHQKDTKHRPQVKAFNTSISFQLVMKHEGIILRKQRFRFNVIKEINFKKERKTKKIVMYQLCQNNYHILDANIPALFSYFSSPPE